VTARVYNRGLVSRLWGTPCSGGMQQLRERDGLSSDRRQISLFFPLSQLRLLLLKRSPLLFM